jgi:hypothetical protein
VCADLQSSPLAVKPGLHVGAHRDLVALDAHALGCLLLSLRQLGERLGFRGESASLDLLALASGRADVNHERPRGPLAPALRATPLRDLPTAPGAAFEHLPLPHFVASRRVSVFWSRICRSPRPPFVFPFPRCLCQRGSSTCMPAGFRASRCWPVVWLLIGLRCLIVLLVLALGCCRAGLQQIAGLGDGFAHELVWVGQVDGF